MFNSKFALPGAVLALAIGSVPASAVTVSGSEITSGSGELNNTDGLGFDWDGAPFSAYFDFSVESPFELSLARYGEDGVVGTSEVSGYTLDLFMDGATERLTADTTNCSSAGSAISGSCNMVTSTGMGAQPGDTLYENLKAGEYRLGFFDSEDPQAGFAEFNVSEVAAVPLPTAGLLLIGSIGGLGLLKRRAAVKA